VLHRRFDALLQQAHSGLSFKIIMPASTTTAETLEFMDWTSIIQTGVAVVGFGAIVYQLGQVERSVRSATRWSIYDLAARVKQNIIDNPELRPYFHEAKEITTEDKNYEKVMAVADLFCLYLEKIATQGEGISKDNRKAWGQYVRDVYNNCPAIQIHLKGKERRYSEEFWQLLMIKPTTANSADPKS
jgi:hypothetical protein